MIINTLTKKELSLTKKESLKKGEVLFYENDVCNYIGIVNSGSLVISSSTFEGNEIIYNKLNKGDMFGNNLLFSKDNYYRGDVKAVSDSEVILISKDNIIYLLQNNEEFLKEYLSIHSEFTKSLNTKIKLLSFTSAKERLLYFLFINNGHVTYKSITDLARSIFLTREVTSRLVSSLEKEKIVIRNKHEITLNNN